MRTRDSGAYGANWQSVTASVPDTLRQVIERQVERLPAIVQQLFEVASIVGVEFSAAAVAAGLQRRGRDRSAV